MKQTGMLYMGEMVLALLEDRKTQTRRALRQRIEGDPQYRVGDYLCDADTGKAFQCPYGHPGDRINVKETHYAWGRWEKRFSEEKGRDEWHFIDMTIETGHCYRYAADVSVITMKRDSPIPGWHKRPAIFMPRVASRIALEVTGVRVERLQDISEADAKAEGAEPSTFDFAGPAERALLDYPLMEHGSPYRNGYALLWESINGSGSWDANPLVWVVEFRRLP